MDLSLLSPFVEVPMLGLGGAGYTPGTPLTSKMPSLKNFAEDPKCIQDVQNEIYPVMTFTRATRFGLEEEWRTIRRMEWLMHDEGRKFFGRSDAYLPIYNRNCQTLTSRLARGLFPGDDYMDVAVRGAGQDPQSAKPLKTYLQWEFEENARLRDAIKPFLRQLVNYGNAPLKVWYRKRIQKEGRNSKTARANLLGLPEFGEKLDEGLAVEARSIFSVFIHPVTANSLEEATLIFEDIVVPRGYVEDMMRAGKWKNGEAALHAPPIPNLTTDMADQITNQTAITSPTPGILGPTKIGQMLPLTEVWTTLCLPKEAYLPGEDPEEAVPVRIVMSGSMPVEITRNPFYHQRPPYLIGRMNAQPGLFYGYGFGRVSRSLQYLANDFANQTNDCAVYALNPIAIVNPGAIAGPLRPLSPGVTWYMTDTQAGVQFKNPDISLIGAGQEMLKQITGMLQDYGGAPPIMQGSSSGGTARTATGGQILQNNTQMPLQDIIEDLEAQVMIPLMKMATKLGQQYCPPEIMAAVAGEPVTIDLGSLGVDATFRWLASQQIGNQQQRVQMQQQFVQMVMPLVPLLQQLGYRVDPTAPLRKMYSDLGFRGFSEFIQPMQMGPPGMPGAGGPPGQPPGPPGADDQARSALEQVPGGGGPMAEGEGGDFMQVRQGADQIAALAGMAGVGGAGFGGLPS